MGAKHVEEKKQATLRNTAQRVFLRVGQVSPAAGAYHSVRSCSPSWRWTAILCLSASGSGSFIINGEEFPVQPGCVAWIQCSQVLTICPEFGEALKIWVAAFDYQLLSYYMFNQITNLREIEIVTGLPVIGPDGDDVKADRAAVGTVSAPECEKQLRFGRDSQFLPAQDRAAV